MRQPLVTRPSYGQGNPSLPIAESKLPSGEPAGRGVPLDPGIPGTKTFAKPEDDIREQRKDDEPIHRVDDASDLAKDRSRIDTCEENSSKHDGIGAWGKGEWDSSSRTKYPYRDGIPNAHSAADARFVVSLFLLRQASERQVDLEGSVRVAATIAEVSQGLSSKVLDKAKTCTATLKRADVKNLRWIFSVDCGNGPKAVKLKASRKSGNIVKLSKMDVFFKCSCPAWQWLGPEHNAQQGGYLDGKPRGTASTPDIQDPKRQNRVCKHVAAVIAMVRHWDAPAKPKAKRVKQAVAGSEVTPQEDLLF